MRRLPAAAKINLALVVGPADQRGRHRVTTVLQRIDLCDRVEVRPGPRLVVRGFPEDTLVRKALTRLADRAGVLPRWDVHIGKRIPVAAGLGGGSSDAGTALRLANETLESPLPAEELVDLAATIGADVPFFLVEGPHLGEGDGSSLRPLELPQDYWVLLMLPDGVRKASTAAVYAEFDRRGGVDGYDERRAELLEKLAAIRRPRDLAALPANDLASSAAARDLEALGAFRADVSGAGPTVYGLFHHRVDAVDARRRIRARGRTWISVPTWYF